MVTEAEALDKSHADLARRLADAGREIASLLAALREALPELRGNAERLPESCLSLKKEILAWIIALEEKVNEQKAGD